MPNFTTKNKDNKIYLALKKQFGSIPKASDKLGFCQKTLWNMINGRPISASMEKRILAAGYSPITFKKKNRPR